jgi:hypothetical protein
MLGNPVVLFRIKCLLKGEFSDSYREEAKIHN